MRFLISLSICGVFLFTGCEEGLLGIGGGVAASETFHSWQANLEEKKAALELQYEQAFEELQKAPDPNAVKFANQKIESIRQQQLVNEGALLAVKTALELPGKTKDEKTDVIVTAGVGLAALAYQIVTKRKLNLKYAAHKQGQAELEKVNPDAGKQLYSIVGEKRARLL